MNDNSNGTSTPATTTPAKVVPKKIDPEADIAEILPPNARAEIFKREVDEASFCRYEREYGHINCNPWETLDGLIKRMVELKIGYAELAPGKKYRIQWNYYLYSKMCKLGCDSDTHRSYKPDLGTEVELGTELNRRIHAAGVREGGPSRMQDPEKPNMYWDRSAQKYCVQDENGTWQHESGENALVRLKKAGISDYAKECDLSDCELELLATRNEKAIDMVSPLAGYPVGLVNVNGKTILVDRSFELIKPVAGDCAHVWELLSGLLTEVMGDKEDKRQLWHFLTHLKCSYNDLEQGRKSGSIASFLVGPKDCGKTLLLKTVVVPLLGGRYADAYLHISGQTSFNDELMSKEAWVLDDAPAPEDAAARRRLSGLLKQAVAADHVACHPKHKPQVSLPLYRRLFIALNEDEIGLLPLISEALDDKFMMLKCHKFVMPDGCLPLPVREKQGEFEDKIKSELPAFLEWLLKQDLSRYADRRFGVKPFKHPELVAKNVEASGLDLKYKLICSALFERKDQDAVELTAADIYTKIMNSTLNEKANLAVFKNPQSVGHALRELKESPTKSHLISVRMLHGTQRWTLKQEAEMHEKLRGERIEHNERSFSYAKRFMMGG